jgi:hypothetical protein
MASKKVKSGKARKASRTSSVRKPMTRKRFIRTVGMGAGAIAAAGLGLSGVAKAQKTAGSGLDMYPSQGFGALQEAVTAGGTIILHDTWDFEGQNLTVGLGENDVEIIGAKAVINNGSISSEGLVRMKLSGLVLNSNSWYGINLVKSSGAAITGCEIKCLIPDMWPFAIGSYSWNGETDVGLTDLNGAVEISNNVIDGANGVYIYESKADVSICRNIIRNCNTAVGFILPREGSLNMDGNTISLVWEGTVGLLLQVADDNFPTEFESALVSNNKLECGASWFGLGYGRWNTQADPKIVVMKNELHIEENDWAAFVLHNDCINTVWAQNKVTGKIRRGVSVATFDGNWPFERTHYASKNTFKANNFSGAKLDPVADSIIDIYFYPEAAHYYFDINADNNTVIGNAGEVVDLGIGNTITGSKNLKKHHEPVGGSAKKAEELIRKLRRARRH